MIFQRLVNKEANEQMFPCGKVEGITSTFYSCLYREHYDSKHMDIIVI